MREPDATGARFGGVRRSQVENLPRNQFMHGCRAIRARQEVMKQGELGPVEKRALVRRGWCTEDGILTKVGREMALRMRSPQVLTVSHPMTAVLGIPTTFTVTVATGALPVEGARVAISHPEAPSPWAVLTDEQGVASFPAITFDHPGPYDLVVTEANASAVERRRSTTMGRVSSAHPATDQTASSVQLTSATMARRFRSPAGSTIYQSGMARLAWSTDRRRIAARGRRHSTSASAPPFTMVGPPC